MILLRMRLTENNRAGLCALAVLMILGGAHPATAQDRPLQTSDAEVIAPGSMRAQIGFDFLQDVTFPLFGLSGDRQT